MPTRLLAAIFCALGALPASSATLSFDNLPVPPALSASVDFVSANGGSLSYGGVTWDPGLSVVGNAYRVDAVTPGPLFGVPHSGSYFITNNTSDASNGDRVTLTTNLILTGAWFGQNEYYGFGGGADQITIFALSGTTVLGSVVFPLPDNNPGQPEPLSFVDTSAFLALSGITGYRIDRHSLAADPTTSNWVADDFQFQAVPEPAVPVLVAVLGSVLLEARRRRRGARS